VRRIFLIFCLLWAMPWQVAQAAIPGADRDEDRRIALVIGNGNYPDAPLGNPVNDARAMSTTLRSLGFAVIHYENVDRKHLREAIREFGQRLEAGGVGLFYFAGHGFSVAERTLLLPVDASSRSPARLSDGIDLQRVVESMSAPRPGKLNLVLLDACLNNPFSTGGSGPPPLSEQTLLGYATAPGGFAADGAQHGLYTAMLLKTMTVPGLRVEEVFQRVQSAVREASNEQQIPALFSSLSAASMDFRFLASAPDPSLLPILAASDDVSVLTLRSRGILPKDSAEQYELTFWESIKDSTHASDYEAYLQAYPNGRFAGLARARIERLGAAVPKAAPPAERPQPAPAARKSAERAPAAPAAKAAPERVPAVPAAPAPTKPTPAGAIGLSEVRDCPACPALVALPGGAFTMGSNSDDPSEKPAHHVTLRESFAIGKYEVTAEQWNACAAADACPRIATIAGVPNNSPARDISWDDAQQYVKWLSKVSGKSYRLPSEAEWEFAARGGTSTRYWWGEQMRPGNANCKGCGEPWQAGAPTPVGSFAANPYGLHDMNGSVWEWVSDCWHNSYAGAPADGRAWNDQHCNVRVIRGGSWREGANYMLSSTRFKYDANVRVSQNGFRVARDLK